MEEKKDSVIETKNNVENETNKTETVNNFKLNNEASLNNKKGKNKFVIFLVTIILGLSLLTFGVLYFSSFSSLFERCDHVYEEVAGGEEATCSSTGTKFLVCKLCGKEKVEEIPIDENAHKPNACEEAIDINEEEYNNAACGAEYFVYGKCSYCNKIVEMSILKKSDHLMSDEIEIWYETIDKESHYKYSAYKCLVCNEIIKSTIEKTEELHNCERKHECNKQKAIDERLCTFYENECSCGCQYETKCNHNYDGGEFIIRPTCTSGGRIKYTCQNDGCVDPIKEEDLTSLGHLYKDGEENATCIDRTCLRCFNEIKASENHEYLYDADCVDRVCVKCNKLIKAKTKSHVYNDNYTCHDRTCINCNSPESTIKATTEHLLANTTNVRKDCTDNNEKYYKHCDICQDDIEYEYDKTYSSHDFSIQLEYNPASCEKTGYIVYQCKNCSKTKEEMLSASSHNDVVVQSEHISPTCTKDGLEVYQCTNCKRRTTVVLSKLGHIYKDDFLCHDKQCLRCDETLYHTLEHTYGVNSKVCLVCGDNIQLDTPIIAYDVDTNRVYAENQTLNTKFYLYGNVFDGSLINLEPGVYEIKARNEDSNHDFRNSDYSNEIKVVVLENDCISAKYNNKNDKRTITINVAAMPEKIAYTIEYECFDVNGDAIKDSKGNFIFSFDINSEDSKNEVIKIGSVPKTGVKFKITIKSKYENVVFYQNYTYELTNK